MEEIGATIPKYQLLQVLWHLLCDYARRTILFRPIRLFTRESLPSFLKNQYLKLIEIGSAILLIQPYNCLLVTTKIFTWQSFFSSFFLLFSSHTFSWACGSFHEPRKFFQTLFYTFTCLSNNSLISSWI